VSTVALDLVALPGGAFRMGDDSVWAYPGDGEQPELHSPDQTGSTITTGMSRSVRAWYSS
jgi:hypothetical protein